jgi:hypothetical protein
MGYKCATHPPPAGFLVRNGYDDVVRRVRSFPLYHMLTRFVQYSYSVAVRPQGSCGYRTRESPLLHGSS